jgi:hypothetical protein
LCFFAIFRLSFYYVERSCPSSSLIIFVLGFWMGQILFDLYWAVVVTSVGWVCYVHLNTYIIIFDNKTIII